MTWRLRLQQLPGGLFALQLAGVAGAFLLAEGMLTDPRLALLVLGGVLVGSVLAVPRAVLLVVLVLAGTIWYAPHVPLSFGGVRTDEVELLCYGLLAWWAVRLLRGQAGPELRQWGRAAAVLVLAVLVGAAYGVLSGSDWSRVVANTKTFGLYLLVLPIAALFPGEVGARRLESWVMRLVIAGSLVVVWASATGVVLQGRPGTVIDLNDLAMTARLRPALMPFLFVATVLLAGRISAAGWSLPRALTAGLFGAVWALTFNRSSWVALAIAIGVLAVVRPGPRRQQSTVATVLVTATVVPVLFLLAGHGTLGPLARSVVTRAQTVTSGSVVTSGSYTDRQREYRDAFHALARSPVLGVGVGGLYGARRSYYDPELRQIRYFDRPFSHNSWLYLYLQLGALGVAGFLLLIGTAASAAITGRHRQEPDQALRAAAGLCVLLGLALESLFNPNLLLRPNILAFVVVLVLMRPVSPDTAPDGD